MADWETPKVDWIASDFWGYKHYNREVNNLQFLYDFSKQYFSDYSIVDMESGKNVTDIPYAKLVNTMEENLETINQHTYNLDIGDKQVYSTGVCHTWTYDEMNRVESASLNLYRHLMVTPRMIPHLAFGLGKGMGFPRVKYKTDEEIGYRFSFKLGKERGFK